MNERKLDEVLAEADPRELLDARNVAFIVLRAVFAEMQKEGKDPRLVAYAIWASLCNLLLQSGMSAEQLTEDLLVFADKPAAANDDSADASEDRR